MKFTRRDFVKFGGAAAAAICLPKSIFAAKSEDVLMNQTAQSFRELAGTEFYVWNDDISTSAILKSVEDFPHKTATGECFSMTFEIRLKRAQEGIYNMFHPKIGNFELFMTEGTGGKRASLIATVNRI